MCTGITTLAKINARKGLKSLVELQFTYDELKRFYVNEYTQRAKRRYDSEGAFKIKIDVPGGNGNGNSSKKREISQSSYSL